MKVKFYFKDSNKDPRIHTTSFESLLKLVTSTPGTFKSLELLDFEEEFIQLERKTRVDKTIRLELN
jgi:hypothetical protein